jgi:hypothetical protein
MVADQKSGSSTRRSLRPPQFGLRTLLAIVTVCGILLALRQWLDPIVIFVLVFLAACVFCHVVGNAIGTRLRQIGDLPDAIPPEDSFQRLRVPPQPQDFAPATHLSRRQSLGWVIVIASSVGATSGAIGGGLFTFLVARGEAGPLEIVIGVIAFAVLGGLVVFAVFGFAQVLLGAIRQALNAPASANPTEARSK